MTDLAQRPSTNGSGSPPDERRDATDSVDRRGFRPSARRRKRIVAGVVLAALAVAGNVWLYANLDAADPVLQVTRDVTAGEKITADMLRTVDVGVDDSVNVVPAEQLPSVIGSYAKVRLVSGSLIAFEALQREPLVGDGASIVAVRVPDGSLPIGLRERVLLDLVLPSRAAPGTDTAPAPLVIPGRAVGLPHAPDSSVGLLSLSVEVAATDAAQVAAAEEVRIVLREPTADPAADGTP